MSTSHARHVPNDTGTDSDAIRGFYSYNRLTNRGHESELWRFHPPRLQASRDKLKTLNPGMSSSLYAAFGNLPARVQIFLPSGRSGAVNFARPKEVIMQVPAVNP